MLTNDEITALLLRHKGRVTQFARAIEKHAASTAPAEGRETKPTLDDAERMGEKGAPHSEPERMLYEAYCKGHCWPVGPWVINPKTGNGEYYGVMDRIRFAMWRDRAALATAPTMPHEGREPTGDELRKLVREISDASGGPSDAPQPADYVLGGWRAALATAPAKPVEEREPGLRNFNISREWITRMSELEPDDGVIAAGGSTSCLCCGHVGERAAWHISHPSIYVCKTCKGLATAPTTSDAARDVLAERRRQIEQEGWTLKHDDEHDGGQLPMAAASYAVAASYASAGLFPMPKGAPPTSWPWRKSWWKPTTPRRDLVKAGALILAEIERIDRAAAKEKKA